MDARGVAHAVKRRGGVAGTLSFNRVPIGPRVSLRHVFWRRFWLARTRGALPTRLNDEGRLSCVGATQNFLTDISPQLLEFGMCSPRLFTPLRSVGG